MKESSSRFVDQITLDKLLSEKLEKVHHFPDTGIDFPEPLFKDWPQYQDTLARAFGHGMAPVQSSSTEMLFESLVQGNHVENQMFSVQAFLSGSPVVNLVFYHGLFEENREIYHFLFSNLTRLGVNVYLCTMPYHYERMPAKSVFSGEYFWSAYFERTRNAFKQAVYDLHLVREWIACSSSLPVIVGGFSMGGAVALIYGAFQRLEDAIVALNPAVSLSEIVWDSPLCKTIKADYLNAGYEIQQLRKAYRSFEPVAWSAPRTPVKRIFMAYGSYDLVTSPELYRTLVSRWQLTNTIEYKSGHLNMLRVPRVANDIVQFWQNNGTV
ncbi:MAG: hypothetical protein JXR76_19265 [Deltaproteobacteria bacterium]|nr:hypothetical protein [Deltaproteobacteria bacterium]